MNLLKRAAFLRNLSGNLSPTAANLNKMTEVLAQDEELPHFTGVGSGAENRGTIWSLTGTIANRSTNSTSGFTDIGSYTLDMGSTYGNIDQTQPVYHPGNSNLVRLYRATNGYLEMKLGFIWSGNPANFITNFGTGGYIKYINRTRGITLTQNFLTETVGTASGTVRYTKVGNLTQTNEAVGDVVRLEFYFTGG